jgi:succinoglycan biosynthesis protein ExoM
MLDAGLRRSLASPVVHLSVCIATYRRCERLAAVLGDLLSQERLPDQVVVVDNDAEGSARPIVEQIRSRGAPFELKYEIQPERNIAKTRNRTFALATGVWVAFIDDDERAPADWLRKLSAAAEKYNADGVLSPVEPTVPSDAPGWIRRGRFYDFPHSPTGTAVPLNRMRFGNVLLRSSLMRCEAGPFDERYGLGMGEDCDLLIRLAQKGAHIVWTEDAPVFEPIEPKRLSLRWLMLRAFSGGQEFARFTLMGRLGPMTPIGRRIFFVRVAAQALTAALLAALALPVGRHRAAAWLIKAWANLGKLSAYWGIRSTVYG